MSGSHVPLAARARALDERISNALRGALALPLGRAARLWLYVLCFLSGAAAAALLGGAGLGEAAVLGAVFLAWAFALFGGTRARALDALLLGVLSLLLFAARMAVLPVVSPDCQEYLLPWRQTMAGMRFSQVMQTKVGDYTVLYQYFVFLLSRLPLDPVAMYKAFSLLFEALLAAAAASLCCLTRERTVDSTLYRGAYLLVLCLPTVLLGGAVWAQCDAVYAALALWGVVHALRNRPLASGACFALSLCFKLQAVFLLPVTALLFYWRKLSLRHALFMAGVFVLAALPAMFGGKTLKDVLAIYLYQMQEYDPLVLGAPSLYQLFTGAPLISEQAAAMLGVLLSFAAMTGILFWGARREHESPALCADVCFCLCLCIPFFLPYMHERYFFLADVLSVVYAISHPRRAFVPLLAVGASLNGYALYLFGAPVLPFSNFVLALLCLCALCTGWLARDARCKEV